MRVKLSYLLSLLAIALAAGAARGDVAGRPNAARQQPAGDASPVDNPQRGRAANKTGHHSSVIPRIDIGYKKYVLDNGLTLIVHTDHSTPIVAVDIWYHVGSKNEGPGQHGFAHLFEHLMFQGSEHWHGEYFKPFERAGATDMNGTTDSDRTNYFASVPTAALDMALWMESDRMGHFLGAVDGDRLDEQRGVVLNEKRQGENQPYGRVFDIIPPNTYPAGHPYSWPTIGSKKDLEAASLTQVKAWFSHYYGPANAVLVLAGDIAPDAAKAKVEKYFASIDPGPPVAHQKRWVAPMIGQHRQIVYDRVPQARIYKVWNIPPAGAAETTRLEIAASMLACCKASPLYKHLVYDDRIATDVSAFVWDKEIGSQFIVSATAKADVKLATVETAIDEQLQRFIKNGPQAAALRRARTRLGAAFVRGIQSVGGLGGVADILAEGEVYQNDPAAYKRELAILRKTTPDAIQKTTHRWLTQGDYVLSVKPFGGPHSTGGDVARKRLPAIGQTAGLDLGEIQQATLANGLKVRLAERHDTPLVDFDLVFDAGYAADPPDAPGTASLTMGMLDEGTANRGSEAIATDLDALGATLSADATLDASRVHLSALAGALDGSLDIFADVVRNATFPANQFDRLQRHRAAEIRQEKTQPMSLALRTLGPALYGDDHAYGTPLTGSGTIAAVRAMTVADIRAFAKRWLRPANATLVVAGDTTLAELKPLLEKHLGGWTAHGPSKPPHKRLPTVAPRERARIFLLDRPGSQQTTVIAGNLAPPKSSPLDIAMQTVNAVIGGLFNSRLNLDLREAKHWTYGARSRLLDARAQQPFFAFAAVQTDKTAPAMIAMRAQLGAIAGPRPPNADELAAAQANLTRSLPGENETVAALTATLAKSVIFDLGADYYDHYVARVRALDAAALAKAAKRMIHAGAMTWVVVGDLAKIEAPIRKLGWGRVRRIDPAALPADTAKPRQKPHE